MPVIGMTTALSDSKILELGAALAVADFRDARIRPLIERRIATVR
jgi:hypothetical protein